MQTSLVKFDEFKAEIAKYKKINEGLVFDYEDEQGNKDARSHIAKLRKIKTGIAAVHKDLKSEALKVGRMYDAAKNEHTAEVEEMIAVHNDPIKRIQEREEAERQAKIDAELARQEAEAEAKCKEIEEREAEVVRKEAEMQAKEDAIKAEEEAKRAEIDRLEREKIIAHEAAERAKAEAESKAAEEKKVIEQAAAKKIADAKAKALAIENKRLADEATARLEKQQEEQAEQRRIANKKHRAKIYDEIHESVYETIGDVKQTKLVTDALVNGGIKNITINY